MKPCTLHQYQPIEKFHIDPHFIYITTPRDENREELQSYYKLIDEDMEQITKEWLEEFLVPVADEELSNTKTIGSPIVTWAEHVRQANGTKKKKRQEEVQDIESDEEDNTYEDNGSDSPGGEYEEKG
jgi:predicted transcriptional regulator of viral defense system